MAQIAHQMKDKDWVYILDRLMAEIAFVIVEKSSFFIHFLIQHYVS